MDESGTIQWLKPGELGNLPKKTKLIHMTLSFTYTGSKNRNIEERKARSSIRRDLLKEGLQFDAECISATMVERVAVRMVKAHNVQHQ